MTDKEENLAELLRILKDEVEVSKFLAWLTTPEGGSHSFEDYDIESKKRLLEKFFSLQRKEARFRAGRDG